MDDGFGYERHQKRLNDQDVSLVRSSRLMTEDRKKIFETQNHGKNAFLRINCGIGSISDRNPRNYCLVMFKRVDKRYVGDGLGRPYDRQRAVGRRAERSEKFIYRFEQQQMVPYCYESNENNTKPFDSLFARSSVMMMLW